MIKYAFFHTKNTNFSVNVSFKTSHIGQTNWSQMDVSYNHHWKHKLKLRQLVKGLRKPSLFSSQTTWVYKCFSFPARTTRKTGKLSHSRPKQWEFKVNFPYPIEARFFLLNLCIFLLYKAISCSFQTYIIV